METHISERARTWDEAVRLVEAYRLCAMPERFLVGSRSWELDSRGDPSFLAQQSHQLLDFVRTDDGKTDIDIGDRYRLTEPFDIEFNHHGFVVWSAASVLIARRSSTRSGGPQFVAPRAEGTTYGSTFDQPADPGMHEPFAQLAPPAAAAIEQGAPIMGLLDASEFPLKHHGWRQQVVDVRFRPVHLQHW